MIDAHSLQFNIDGITVLYEGAGDPSGIADPQRTPFFVRDLTTDQQDTLNQRLSDHREGKATKSVNTMDVIIVNSDEEIRELQKKPPTHDVSTQTNFSTVISLLEVILKNSTQILQLLQHIPKASKYQEQPEATNNPSLVEYLQSENIDFLMVQTPKKLHPGQETSILSETVPLNSTELSILTTPAVSTHPSSPAISSVSPRFR
ncbi:unnamed protein product [Mytilus coruscus]|uniref:Uncharacterized protein n=1 Tax=Mytilus coruscus TaxID=42192 RepID=A0A6J8CMP9_MYTCO|nr:unnamed protein product [Mytilus coruscus]